MAVLANAVVRTVCPVMRRVEFPGKRRLRWRLPLPTEGTVVVRFPEGMTLRLDLGESLQRDFLAGLHDRLELQVLKRLLARGGDFVDVGAHVGLYAACAAVVLRGRGRVLAFEPNPAARAQLVTNLALTGCDNVFVSSCAASSRPGGALLAVPRTNDPAFSTLGTGEFEPGEAVQVDTTTVDLEVARVGLAPALVKIDAENHELAVLAGMEKTLERRPAVLCEVGEQTAAEVEVRLGARGYRSFRLEARRLRPGPVAGRSGYFNALFLPPGVEVD